MLISIVPLIAAIVGILVYVLASNAKAVELGRVLMWCGILVSLMVAASHVVRL